MKQIFRDAINHALAKLGFPFLTPHPKRTGSEIGYFQTNISDVDLYEMYKRNQIAHNVIFNVALDVFRPGFECTTPEGEVKKEFNAKVQGIYEHFVHQPLFKTYLLSRLYGSSGMLIGFNDLGRFDSIAEPKSKISYAFSIPSNWVMGRVAKVDSNGYAIIPEELSYYELKYLQTGASKIDASRIIHLQPASIENNFEGESALFCIFDVLTILKNIDWSTGQAMFRHGAGLTTIVAGEGADQAQLDAIDEVVSEINAKTVLTLPPGCKKETDRPGALDPKSYYDVIIAEIAGGSGIPTSILVGAQAGSVQASAKDRNDYGDLIAGIQLSDLDRPLKEILELFQNSGQLPDDEFKIKWSPASAFVIDEARGNLYNARAEHEQAKVEEKKVQIELLDCEKKKKALEYKKQKREEEEGVNAAETT